jgi:hypothetical protein
VTLRTAAGEMRGDIDHLVIGPPGVITINTKHHPRGKVLVDGDAITVNGRGTAYVAKARKEAERARSMLATALATDGQPNLGRELRARSSWSSTRCRASSASRTGFPSFPCKDCCPRS